MITFIIVLWTDISDFSYHHPTSPLKHILNFTRQWKSFFQIHCCSNFRSYLQMVLELSRFISGFEIDQQIVGLLFIHFLIGYIFWTKYFLSMVFTWFLIHWPLLNVILMGENFWSWILGDCKYDDIIV